MLAVVLSYKSAGADTMCVCRKYQFMEANQQRRAAGLKDKMPDIQKTLDTVRFLKTRKVRGSLIYTSMDNVLMFVTIVGFRPDRGDV